VVGHEGTRLPVRRLVSCQATGRSVEVDRERVGHVGGRSGRGGGCHREGVCRLVDVQAALDAGNGGVAGNRRQGRDVDGVGGISGERTRAAAIAAIDGTGHCELVHIDCTLQNSDVQLGVVNGRDVADVDRLCGRVDALGERGGHLVDVAQALHHEHTVQVADVQVAQVHSGHRRRVVDVDVHDGRVDIHRVVDVVVVTADVGVGHGRRREAQGGANGDQCDCDLLFHLHVS